MQLFVQTDRHVIDVSKIAFVETFHRETVVVRFVDGAKLILSRGEGGVLLDLIALLAAKKAVLAVRAPTEKRA